MSDATNVLKIIKDNPKIRELVRKEFMRIDEESQEIFFADTKTFGIGKLSMESGTEGPIAINFHDLEISSLPSRANFMFDDCFGIEDPKTSNENAASIFANFLFDLSKPDFSLELRSIFRSTVFILRMGNKAFISRVSSRSSAGSWVPGTIIAKYGKLVFLKKYGI